MTDGPIYKLVSNRMHGNGAIGGYGVTTRHPADAHKWERTPWGLRRMFGYKWRRYDDLYVEGRWEYGTDEQVAKEFLDEQFAPHTKWGHTHSLPTSDPLIEGLLWNNKGVISMSEGPTARRGGE